MMNELLQHVGDAWFDVGVLLLCVVIMGLLIVIVGLFVVVRVVGCDMCVMLCCCS